VFLREIVESLCRRYLMSDHFFEQPEIWGQPPDPYQIQVRADVLSLLPEDAVSILDVGCGDGFIAQALPAHLQVVALDASRAALRQLSDGRCLGRLPNLPFPDGAFDLVMANDVLEHLPDGELEAAARELRRAARRYLLITVPFGEDLPAHSAQCAACGSIYHVNHHQRRFDLASLSGLFSGRARLLEQRLSGSLTRPATDPTIAWRRAVGLYHVWPPAVCPRCGSKYQVQSGAGPLTRRLLDAARSALWARRLQERGPWSLRTELMALYAFDLAGPVNGAETPSPARAASLMAVDFANPLQAAVPDFTVGAPWAQFRGPAQLEISEVGLTWRAGMNFIEVSFPAEAHLGDQVVVEARGLSGALRLKLYALDGGAGHELFLGELEVAEQWSESALTLDQIWLPDQFGLMLRVYAEGPMMLRRLTLAPADPGRTLSAPFVEIRPGHNRIVLRNEGSLISWGYWSDQAGRLPCPELAVIDTEEMPSNEQSLPPAVLLSFAERQAAQLEHAYQTMTALQSAAAQQRDLAAARADALQAALDRQTAVLAAETAALDQAHAELQRLTAALDQAHAELQRLTAALDQAHAELQRLTAALDQAHAELQRLTAALAERTGWRWLVRHSFDLLWGLGARWRR
jgi:SAM-dependent methyltransferase